MKKVEFGCRSRSLKELNVEVDDPPFPKHFLFPPFIFNCFPTLFHSSSCMVFESNFLAGSSPKSLTYIYVCGGSNGMGT
jgi:hypothetical protein